MNQFLLVFLFISSISIAQEQNPVHSYDNPDFEIGSTQYLFGDNVVLRKQPSKNSDELEKLSIGAELIIQAQENRTMLYNGYTCNWYKVKTKNGKTGYIMGGLIARAHSRINDTKYVISVQQSENEGTKVEYRFITTNGSYISGKADLNTHSFLIKTDGNKGLEGIEKHAFLSIIMQKLAVLTEAESIFSTMARN